MKKKIPLFVLSFITIASIIIHQTVFALSPMHKYFMRPDQSFRWDKLTEQQVEGGTIYTLSMVSQTWQNIPWEHFVQVFYPDNMQFPHFAALINTGGQPSAEYNAINMMIANRIGSPFVILYNIPNQPLFQGLSEDALIVYTWMRFFETRDATWPLHFPMAKAVLKCMDVVQSFLPQVNKVKPEEFLITGASKRGWTSWLVGASRDERVAGIAPMVIDTLNLPAQVPHHLEFYRGVHSDEIDVYEDMLVMLNTPPGKKLVSITDPYSFRNYYTMPKLIINGTNDRYWALDALNLYWDGLPQPKSVLYVPNSGHGLEDRDRVINTITAFSQLLAEGYQLPEIEWHFETVEGSLELNVQSEPAAEKASLWVSYTPIHDFRDAKWISVPMSQTDEGWHGVLTKPQVGWAACFAELVFTHNEQEYTLSTGLQIIGSNDN